MSVTVAVTLIAVRCSISKRMRAQSIALPTLRAMFVPISVTGLRSGDAITESCICARCQQRLPRAEVHDGVTGAAYCTPCLLKVHVTAKLAGHCTAQYRRVRASLPWSHLIRAGTTKCAARALCSQNPGKKTSLRLSACQVIPLSLALSCPLLMLHAALNTEMFPGSNVSGCPSGERGIWRKQQ